MPAVTRVANFYPRSPCGERLTGLGVGLYLVTISIHALLAESDPGKVKVVEPGFVFLSTLSLRRATTGPMKGVLYYVYFYPRSPCGERRTGNVTGIHTHWISIHALLAESDEIPTRHGRAGGISIHALLAESDPLYTAE